MAISDQDIVQFGQRVRAALPTAISEAFGGASELSELTEGVLPLLVMDLGEAHHLHLEIEVALGRLTAHTLVIVMRPSDGQALFGLEPAGPEQLGEPETQLRLLAEFTEGAEALATALAGTLAATGFVATLRVSGASLEEAAVSPIAAGNPLGSGEPVAFAGVLARPEGQMPLVVGAGEALVGAMGAGAGAEAAGGVGSAADRAASFAARRAERAASNAYEAPPQMPMAVGAGPVPFPTQAPAPAPAVTAHPFAFGQIDPAPAGTRGDRGVDLILDVALNVRVELGSTNMTVEEVLALTPGSVIELDRLAGEPVDIVINDRLIARGEVVVVEENFGVRVTEIVTARNRPAFAG